MTRSKFISECKYFIFTLPVVKKYVEWPRSIIFLVQYNEFSIQSKICFGTFAIATEIERG